MQEIIHFLVAAGFFCFGFVLGYIIVQWLLEND